MKTNILRKNYYINIITYNALVHVNNKEGYNIKMAADVNVFQLII